MMPGDDGTSESDAFGLGLVGEPVGVWVAPQGTEVDDLFVGYRQDDGANFVAEFGVFEI